MSPRSKRSPAGPRPLGQSGAGRDHVLLQVEADELDLASAQHGQQMVDRKGEVGLAAAEVDHPQRPVRAERGHDVVDQLEEAVDLAELVVAALAHVAVRGHDAELDEKRHRRPLLEQVLLLPIVRLRRRGAGRRAPEHRLPEHLPVGVGGLQQRLPVVGQQRAEALAGAVRRKVLVRRPVGQVGREPIRRLAAQLDGSTVTFAGSSRDRGFESTARVRDSPSNRSLRSVSVSGMMHMMGLTKGNGPFGEQPRGRFDFDPPARIRFVEDFPRRVRAEKDGATVIDSERVKLVWVTGTLPQYAFPAEDVTVRAHAVKGVEGYVALAWNAVDAWFEEEEQVFVHVRDPYSRIDVPRRQSAYVCRSRTDPRRGNAADPLRDRPAAAVLLRSGRCAA